MMTHEEHRQRHVRLNDALDELIADWMAQTDGDLGKPVMELAIWAKQQTAIATANRFEKHAPSHMPETQLDRG